MQSNTQTLGLADKEAQTLFRALLEYEKSLRFSAMRDSIVVVEEMQTCQQLQERISLLSYYPDDAPAAR